MVKAATASGTSTGHLEAHTEYLAHSETVEIMAAADKLGLCADVFPTFANADFLTRKMMFKNHLQFEAALKRSRTTASPNCLRGIRASFVDGATDDKLTEKSFRRVFNWSKTMYANAMQDRKRTMDQDSAHWVCVSKAPYRNAFGNEAKQIFDDLMHTDEFSQPDNSDKRIVTVTKGGTTGDGAIIYEQHHKRRLLYTPAEIKRAPEGGTDLAVTATAHVPDATGYGSSGDELEDM